LSAIAPHRRRCRCLRRDLGGPGRGGGFRRGGGSPDRSVATRVWFNYFTGVFFIFIFLLIGAARVPFETASEGRKGRMMLRCEGDEKGIVGSIWAVGSTWFWPGWTAGMVGVASWSCRETTSSKWLRQSQRGCS